MTDITGFGLAGHGLEMAKLSDVDFQLSLSDIQLLPGTLEYAGRGVFPGGMERNREYYGQWVDQDTELPDYHGALIYDPQTSGGLADGGVDRARGCAARRFACAWRTRILRRRCHCWLRPHQAGLSLAWMAPPESQKAHCRRFSSQPMKW